MENGSSGGPESGEAEMLQAGMSQRDGEGRVWGALRVKGGRV